MFRNKLFTAIFIFLLLGQFLFSDSWSSTSLQLKGIIASKSILGLNQLIGSSPGVETAISLDSGDILLEAEGIGVEVGTWSVSSNSSSALVLNIEYGTFSDVAFPGFEIAYRVHNGTDWVDSGALFATLVRTGGIYRSEDNSGPIYIKRTDAAGYPPSSNYKTTISFTLVSL